MVGVKLQDTRFNLGLRLIKWKQSHENGFTSGLAGINKNGKTWVFRCSMAVLWLYVIIFNVPGSTLRQNEPLQLMKAIVNMALS